MLTLRLENGFDKHETTNSYFSYIEERQIRKAQEREALDITNKPGTIVVGYLESIQASHTV